MSNLIEKWDTFAYVVYNTAAKILYLLKYPKIHRHIKRNVELKDKHKGERCFIVLNGPSLNNYDLTKIADETVFATNYFYQTDYFDVVKPNYYCATDGGYFAVSHDAKEHLENLFKKSDPNCKFIFNIKYLEQFEPKDNVFLTYGKHMPNLLNIRNNLASITSNFISVSMYTMNIAIYMGFKDIYVLGYDFAPGILNHFYKNTDTEVREIAMQMDQTLKDDVCGKYWQYSTAHIKIITSMILPQKMVQPFITAISKAMSVLCHSWITTAFLENQMRHADMMVNIVYSSSDFYSQCTGISILSLLENNKDIEEMQLYILDTDISTENKKKIAEIAESFHRPVTFLPAQEKFEENVSRLKLTLLRGAYSTYARVMLNAWFGFLDKVLLIDSDTLVVGSIKDLWETDLEGKLIGAVPDMVVYAKNWTGEDLEIINKIDYYYNMGIVLCDLKRWREENIDQQIVTKLRDYKKPLRIADQSIINWTLNDRIKRVHLRYNYYTAMHGVRYQTVVKTFSTKKVFSEDEFNSARQNRQSSILSVILSSGHGLRTASPLIKNCICPIGTNPHGKRRN